MAWGRRWRALAGLALQTVARAARGGQTLVKWGMYNRRLSSRWGPESRWHKRVLGPLCCVLPLCHVSQCHVSRCRVPLFLGLSPVSSMRRITSGPRELSGLQSAAFPHASPRCLHAARAGTASGGRDAGTRPCSTSGLVCLRHNNMDVQGDHVHTIAVTWVVATAVRGMRRSGRRGAKEEAASLSRSHRQPVALRRPACLFCH